MDRIRRRLYLPVPRHWWRLARLGVPAIDTPYPDHTDPAGLRREADAAAVDGFAGKILIHPAQIDVVNAAFTPPDEQVRWAERVNTAFTANPDSGVFAMDGKMIDRPHWKLAQRILAGGGPARDRRSQQLHRPAHTFERRQCLVLMLDRQHVVVADQTEQRAELAPP